MSHDKGPTNVQRDATSPALPKAAGVVITGPTRTDLRSPWILHGSFNVPHGEAEALGRPIHRAVALVIQRGEYHNVVMPFREYVLFADDEVAAPSNGVGGYFHIDLHAHQGGPAPGEYHILVSIGEHVSAVLEATITP